MEDLLKAFLSYALQEACKFPRSLQVSALLQKKFFSAKISRPDETWVFNDIVSNTVWSLIEAVLPGHSEKCSPKDILWYLAINEFTKKFLS